MNVVNWKRLREILVAGAWKTILHVGRRKTVSVSSIRINHYFTKSKEEYMKKKNRGMADLF